METSLFWFWLSAFTSIEGFLFSYTDCPNSCPKFRKNWGSDMTSDICARMHGSLILWLNYFNKMAFSRNGWRNSGPIPCPLAYGLLRDPEQRRNPWLNACGKGVLNGKIGPAVKERPLGQFCAGSFKISELMSEGQKKKDNSRTIRVHPEWMEHSDRIMRIYGSKPEEGLATRENMV
jgi:hypothetical protein